MTRTERAAHPAAVNKDRRSRSGLTKTEWNHKNGDGAHNWGSFRSKGNDELTGRLDGELEAEDKDLPVQPADGDIFDLDEELLARPVDANLSSDAGNDFKPTAPIARGASENHSVVATSPTDSVGSLGSFDGGKPGLGRRESAITDEEMEAAKVFRAGQYKKGGVDLAHIAKTSYGISRSSTTYAK